MTAPLTVAELRALLDELPDDEPVWVHGSNGWGPGPARAFYGVERDGRGVHLFGAHF